MMISTRLLLLLGLVASTYQSEGTCRNCVVLGKREKAMFRMHSDACLQSSRVAPQLLHALCRGHLQEDPALKAHLYCVLLKCKLITKDGRLQKAALMGRLTTKGDWKNTTKILERCAEQAGGGSAEERAWRLFRCGFDKKALLFDYMPLGDASA